MGWAASLALGKAATAARQRTGTTPGNRRIVSPGEVELRKACRGVTGGEERKSERAAGRGGRDRTGDHMLQSPLGGLHTESYLAQSAATDNARSSANTRDSQHRLYTEC